MNRRAESKEKTRRKAITAARKAFATTDYHAVTIRGLADMMKMSTGAIFGNFTDKADLWRASMPLPVPADVPVTRAAHMLLDGVQAVFSDLEVPKTPGTSYYRDYYKLKAAIDLATTPLDGDAWARHLQDRPVSFPTSDPVEAASSVPSGDAAARG